MKKILMAIDSNSSGGAERVIATLANQFVEKGDEVILVNADTDSCFYKLDEKVKVIKLRLDAEDNKLKKMLLKYKRIRKLMLEIHPDATICFLIRMEVPVILAGLTTGTRVYTSVRNSATSYSRIERLFRKIFYPKISGVVFQSKSVMEFIDFKAVENKEVIMNPLDEKFLSITAPIPFEQRKKIIITAGRLNAQKNQKILIEAFDNIASSYPEVELWIYGKGELHDELQKVICEKRNGSRIKLMGEKANAIYESRDALGFVLSSNFEGFPNALVEAMASGLPSISTKFDSGVAEELISDGENGYLCSVNDAEELSSKMELLLNLNKADYERMAEKSMQITEMLSPSLIASKWEQFMFKEDKGQK